MSSAMGQMQERQGAFGGVQARAATEINEARIAIRDLDFFYGDNQAL